MLTDRLGGVMPCMTAGDHAPAEEAELDPLDELIGKVKRLVEAAKMFVSQEEWHEAFEKAQDASELCPAFKDAILIQVGGRCARAEGRRGLLRVC